jgi:hypothetical protein
VISTTPLLFTIAVTQDSVTLLQNSVKVMHLSVTVMHVSVTVKRFSVSLKHFIDAGYVIEISGPIATPILKHFSASWMQIFAALKASPIPRRRFRGR